MLKELDLNDIEQLKKLTINFNFELTIEDLKKENDYYIGYIDNRKLVAFLNYSIYYERVEINYIFVMPEYRRRNIATKMLNYMLEKIKNLENITLEVRQSNYSAIELYKTFGFEECALRKNYYGNEDAILMIKKIGDNNG